jgi:hypothetical protein
MNPGATILLAVALAGADAHEQVNPLYKELRQTGIPISSASKSPLPAPSMPDGLDAKAQRAAIQKVAGEDYDVEELMRKSVVAAHVLRIRDIAPSDPKAPARGVDTWFIAYGNLETIANKDFLDRLLRANRDEGKARTLSAVDLAKRGITVLPQQEKNESFGHIVFTFLDRVEISATGHSYWSRTTDSIVAASRLDPRFRNDREFPNQWRPIVRNDDGKLEPGAAQPYDGAAYYVKITRLLELRGALFIEGHLIFAEPVGWFEGANLLRSKLPPVIQGQVRSARRELVKAAP